MTISFPTSPSPHFGARKELWNIQKTTQPTWNFETNKFFSNAIEDGYALEQALKLSQQTQKPVGLSFWKRGNYASIELLTDKELFDTFCLAKTSNYLNEEVLLIDDQWKGDIPYLSKPQKERLPITNDANQKVHLLKSLPGSRTAKPVPEGVVAGSKWIYDWPIKWRELKRTLNLD